jgi:hypothetical protein
LLPRSDVFDDGVGDAADQVAADLHAVDLVQVRLNVADRQATTVESEDLVVKALKAALALAHHLRLKRAPAIPRSLDRHRPVLGRKCLGRRAVARVAGAAGRLLVVLIAQMLGQLGAQRTLHESAREIGQQPAGPNDLRLGPRARQQLVDQPIRQPVANPRRQLDARHGPPRTACRAGISRGSPCGLTALNAGASPVVHHIDPAVRLLG